MTACGGDAGISGNGGANGGGADAGAGDSGAGAPSTLEEACRILGDCVPATTVDGPAELLWRVEVRRDAQGGFSLGPLRTVRVREGKGVPLPPARGPVYVAGLNASGEPVDGQPVAFVDVDVVEARELGIVEEVPVDGLPQTQIGYVKVLPEITSIALLNDTAERELDTITVAEDEAKDLLIGSSSSALTVPAANCGQVTLIESSTIAGVGQALPLGGFQLAESIKAFDKMAPTTCLGLSRFAFVADPRPSLLGWVSRRRGDLLLINADYVKNGVKFFTDGSLRSTALARLLLQLTIIHEATHAANNLLDRNVAANVAGEWNRAAQLALSDSLLQQTRLLKGFRNEWSRMHDGFVDRGWASAYGAASQSDGVQDLAEAGMMNWYGNTKVGEDIAETASWVAMSTDFARQTIPVGLWQREDYACIELRNYMNDGVPSRLAAAYAKIRLLQDLELVTESDADDCLGRVALEKGLSEGLHFSTSGEPGSNGFTRDVSAGIGTRSDGRRVFYVEAGGDAERGDGRYPATARLEIQLDGTVPIDEASWPRGVYRLTDGGPHRFDFTFDDWEQRAGNFYSTVGDVLIGPATNDRIRGAIVLQRGWRPLAPLPVPQTFDPPLVINIVLKD